MIGEPSTHARDSVQPLLSHNRCPSCAPRQKHLSKITLCITPYQSLIKSREHHSLPIQRSPIRRNPLPPESLLHHNPPRLVKTHPSPLHHTMHLALRHLIQPSPRIPLLDISRQIEVGAVEARLCVLGERHARRQPRVAEAVDVGADVVEGVVEGCGDCSRSCEVRDGRGVGAPLRAG